MKYLLLLLFLVAAYSFPLWGTYQPERIFSLLNTNNSNIIQLAYINSESTIIFNNQVNRSEYSYHDGLGEMEKTIQGNNNESINILAHFGNGYKTEIKIKGIRKFIILFTGRDNRTQISNTYNRTVHQSLNIEFTMECIATWSQLTKVGMFDQFTQNSNGNSFLLLCQSNGQPGIITFKQNENQLKINEKRNIFNDKVQNFISHYQLNYQYKNIITYALVNTLGSISFARSKYSNYFGIKSKFVNQQELPDLGLSTYLIDILSYFDADIGKELFNSLVERIEDESIYSDEQHFFTIPEHIQIFEKFPHHKSIKILNSLIYRSLFHKVNHMIGHQSADYHSSKQMHPILRKLLEITWESDFNYLKGQSIYTQSFLNDAYIHSQEQEAQISVSKTSWLLKAIRILIKLNKKQKVLSQGQLQTLEVNLRQYFKSTCYSKQQKVFKSISRIQRMRYYSRILSYQSFLPFVYKIEPKYDESYSSVFQVLRNVTSTKGVVSQQASQFDNIASFNFRGRIWPYFNYKISEMLRTKQDLTQSYVLQDVKSKGVGNLDRALNDMKSLLNKISQYQFGFSQVIMKAVKQQVIGDWQNNKEMYSSWTVTGKVFNSNPELILINSLFLK